MDAAMAEEARTKEMKMTFMMIEVSIVVIMGSWKKLARLQLKMNSLSELEVELYMILTRQEDALNF